MKKYEITLVLSEDLAEPKAHELAKDLAKQISSAGGKVEKEVFWGKRKMAYKIKKNSFGYYFIIVFHADPQFINEFSKELYLNEKILRFLAVDFIEKTSFFEELERGKEEGKPEKRPEGDVRPRTRREPAKKEEVVAEEIEEKESAVEPEPKEIENVVPAEEAVEAEKESTESVEEKTEEVVEEKETATEAPEEIETSVTEEEPAEEKKEERKPKMTEEERKAQLDKKLQELLKDEEVE